MQVLNVKKYWRASEAQQRGVAGLMNPILVSAVQTGTFQAVGPSNPCQHAMAGSRVTQAFLVPLINVVPTRTH